MLLNSDSRCFGIIAKSVFLVGCLILLPNCVSSSGQTASQVRQAGAAQDTTTVDVVTARTGSLRQELEYTGTTRPIQEVSLRAQVEGQLLELAVNVGDRIQQGQVLGRVDDNLLTAAVIAAEAELASRLSEVARAQAQVSEAETRVEQARLQVQQSRADADRLQKLSQDGASPKQQAELAETSARTAAQILKSAQEQVRSQQQAAIAAEGRVLAQQAVIEQARQRQAFTALTAPLTGTVLERPTEPGNLVQPGTEVLKLGDFREVKVLVQVSELELAQIRLGQQVKVRLDALPNQTLQGRVNRISPAADTTARLVPIEITVPNPGERIGSGLLARVSFAQLGVDRIVIPRTAILEPQGDNRGAKPESKGNPGGQPTTGKAAGNSSPNAKPDAGGRKGRKSGGPGTLFVLTGEGEQAKVVQRSVMLGEQADGRIEILSGLKPGERVVIRSGRPLKDGETVRLSVLSEK